MTSPGDDESMRIQPANRTGILIVRLWVEANDRQRVRARITQILDSAGPQQAMAAAATPADIYAVVRSWVEAFVDENGCMDDSRHGSASWQLDRVAPTVAVNGQSAR